MYEQNIFLRNFKFGSIFFKIFENGISKKIFLGILIFASIVFYIFEKANQQKHGPGCLKICKSALLNI